jgi:hypothetical protein
MSLLQKCGWIGLAVGLAHGAFQTLTAQEATNSPAVAQTNGHVVVPVNLLPPLPKPPVEFFRELLAKSVSERRHLLANRPPKSQELILAKLREYELLSPDECELRLSATELRWYLLPVMATAPANRTAHLEKVPSKFRGMIEERLVVWDALSAAEQKELLESQATLGYLADSVVGASPSSTTNAPSAQQRKLDSDVEHWRQLPEEQRHRIVEHFNEIFLIKPQEKDKILRSISEPERKEIERTLKAFEGLQPEQRARCTISLVKFAGLTPEERQQFFKNAERWRQMTPSQRKAWRDVVQRMKNQPPLPPGVGTPPLPPGARTPSITRPTPPTVATTNSN